MQLAETLLNFANDNKGPQHLASLIILENRSLFTHTDIYYAEGIIDRQAFKDLNGTGKRIPHKVGTYNKFTDQMDAYLTYYYHIKSLKHFALVFEKSIYDISQHARIVLRLGKKTIVK